MKAVCVVVAVTLFASVTASGQGQFAFNNRVIPAGIDARFVLESDSPGVSSVGSDFQGQLLGGPAGTPVEKLVLLDNAVEGGLEPAIIRFRGPAGSPSAGYVVQMTPVVPGVPAAGGEATVLIRVFDGPSWEAATYRFERIWSFPLVDLPNMPLGMEPLVLHAVPEPQVWMLALLGVGAACAAAWRRADMGVQR